MLADLFARDGMLPLTNTKLPAAMECRVGVFSRHRDDIGLRELGWWA